MTEEELEIAKAACCVGTIWDEYEGKENFDYMVGLRVKHLIELVQNYHQPSLPSNLDEAAEEIAKSEIPVEAGEALDLNGDCYETDDINWPERCGFIRGFKAGAEWLAGQGETRDDITVTGDFDGKAHIFPIPSSKFNPGDKVVVQIRKK